MTPADLRLAGTMLYGPRFAAPLARDLGVSIRTMHRWIKGERPISVNHRAVLMALLVERGAEIGSILNRG